MREGTTMKNVVKAVNASVEEETWRNNKILGIDQHG